MLTEREQGDVFTRRARVYSVPPDGAGQPQPRPPVANDAHLSEVLGALFWLVFTDHDSGDCDCAECRAGRKGAGNA